MDVSSDADQLGIAPAQLAQRFSVVVPTRNRPTQLARCLETLGRLDYPSDRFEVIVVDDGGEIDLQPRVVPGLEHLIIVKRDHAGPAAARNAGAEAAAGDLLAFVDDDCEVDRRWLAALDHVLAGPRVGVAVAGRVINALPNDMYATATQHLIDYARDWYVRNDPERRYATSNNLALAKDAFFDVGGFDPRFSLAAAEDREFSRRWLKSGRRIVDAPDALVRHAHHLALRGFLRQHFNYGRGAFIFHGDSGGRFSATRFYTGLLVSPMRAGTEPRRSIALSGLLVSSQVATVAGYLREAAAARR
jgi:GT2 family glycosyltransferase